MPRIKAKATETTDAGVMPKTKSESKKLSGTCKALLESSNYSEDIKEVQVKTDPEEAPVVSLSQFKYVKKAHVKIEYEADHPLNEEKIRGIWEPPNWREFLVNLRVMRSSNNAPVDSMRCHMTMDAKAPEKVIRYQSLLSLMLSSQTKDQVTFAAMERLIARGCTVDGILALSDEELGRLIYPVGFWKTKVKYIKKTTQTLKEQYDGDIPDSVDKLCKLTGVGPKMAHICMKVAWNKITGIGVDTHVHRISNRIGWVMKPTNTPEDTRKALESWIPYDLWSEVNHLMVGFGQTICHPVGPACDECLNKHICPYTGKVRKSPNKKPDLTAMVTPIKEEVKGEVSDDEMEEFEVKKENLLVVPKKAPKRKVTPELKTLDVEAENIKVDLEKKTEKDKKGSNAKTKSRKVASPECTVKQNSTRKSQRTKTS